MKALKWWLFTFILFFSICGLTTRLMKSWGEYLWLEAYAQNKRCRSKYAVRWWWMPHRSFTVIAKLSGNTAANSVMPFISPLCWNFHYQRSAWGSFLGFFLLFFFYHSLHLLLIQSRWITEILAQSKRRVYGGSVKGRKRRWQQEVFKREAWHRPFPSLFLNRSPSEGSLCLRVCCYQCKQVHEVSAGHCGDGVAFCRPGLGCCPGLSSSQAQNHTLPHSFFCSYTCPHVPSCGHGAHTIHIFCRFLAVLSTEL